MVRILMIFQNFPSAMISASSEETSFGFYRGERTMQITLSRGNHTNHLLKRKFQTKTNDHRCEIPGRSNSYKAATCFASKYIEQREAWVMGLDYSKQAVENTYQCHFVLYFVRAINDPSSSIIGSLEHWIDGFIRQDFLRCRFHLKWMRIHGNLFRRFSLKR